MKFITQVSRIFVGVLFIFSGMIKLNDPLGFAFKLEEYFSPDVLNLMFLEPFALQLSLFVVIFEVVVGVALLLGYRTKLTVWILFLMIVFFSFLTFYSAYFNKVTDCGCFGDAIPLNPWQSFGKDLILLVFIIILFLGLKYIKPLFSQRANTLFLSFSLVFCIWFGFHVLNHLPVKDFRHYAVGMSIPEGMKSADELGLEPPQYQVIYTLENSETGEVKTVTDKEYIDDKWWENKAWSINSDLTESIKVSDGYEPPIHDFSIENETGDYTEQVLQEDEIVLIISYDISKADVEGFREISDWAWKAQEADLKVLCLNSKSGAEVEEFRHDIQAPFEFMVTDKTTLKTIIRSNPGMVLLRKGVIKGKWHFNDIPTVEEIKAIP